MIIRRWVIVSNSLSQVFDPRFDLAWRGMDYDLWMAYDVRIGRLLDGIVAYSIVSIEIDLV